MKSAIVLPLALAILAAQVGAQDPPPCPETGGLMFKDIYRNVVNMSAEEVKAYANNPANKLKPEPNPSKTGDKPPASAGVSYKKMASQVIGGTRATQGMYPWQVYMSARSVFLFYSWLCGGTIISPTVVLTAAHCVDGQVQQSGMRSSSQSNKRMRSPVTAGGIDRNTTEGGEETKFTYTSIKHAEYNPNTYINDIAILKFSLPWTFSNNINAVRLPRYSQVTNSFQNNAVVVSGYGKTSNTDPASNFLQSVGLTVISNAQCAGNFGTTSVIYSTICTGADPARSGCQGDSGGPLMVRENDGRFTQVGIVSFGSSASCNGFPSAYARVSSFLNWININAGVYIYP